MGRVAGPIVVGYDDTPPARAALRWAAQEAATTGATVIVAYAFPPVQEWLLNAVQIDTDRIRLERARNLRGAWTQPLRARAVPYRTTVVSGRPGPALLRLARSTDASCVVIGADRHHHLGHWGNGPVQRFVQHHAQRPVVTVPAAASGTTTAALASYEPTQLNAPLPFAKEYAERA